mmetsp:Transcript_65238/g.199553  ORF Transcript_65238/g.199553 Transcript_65238/m.199553 type:complete len:274 (+) Transcript_65238:70-891(+)
MTRGPSGVHTIFMLSSTMTASVASPASSRALPDLSRVLLVLVSWTAVSIAYILTRSISLLVRRLGFFFIASMPRRPSTWAACVVMTSSEAFVAKYTEIRLNSFFMFRQAASQSLGKVRANTRWMAASDGNWKLGVFTGIRGMSSPFLAATSMICTASVRARICGGDSSECPVRRATKASASMAAASSSSSERSGVSASSRAETDAETRRAWLFLIRMAAAAVASSSEASEKTHTMPGPGATVVEPPAEVLRSGMPKIRLTTNSKANRPINLLP